MRKQPAIASSCVFRFLGTVSRACQKVTNGPLRLKGNVMLSLASRKNQLWKLTVLFIFCLGANPVSAQKYPNNPSLKKILIALKTSKNDSNRVRLQINAGKILKTFPAGKVNYGDSAVRYFDQAALLSNKLNNIQLKEESLLLKAGYYFAKNDLTAGKAALMPLIIDYQKSEKKSKEAEIWEKLAGLIPDQTTLDNLTDKANWYSNAKALYIQTSRKDKEIEMLSAISFIHIDQDKYELAEQEAKQVLDFYKSNNSELQYKPDLVLSRVAYKRGDLPLNLKYLLDGVKFLVDKQPSAMLDNYIKHLTTVYAYMTMKDKVIEWCDRGIISSRIVREPYFYYVFVHMKVWALTELKRNNEAIAMLNKAVLDYPPSTLEQKRLIAEDFGRCYLFLKQYDKAETYYQSSDRMFSNYEKENLKKNESYINDMIYHYYIQAQFYAESKKFDKADLFINKIDPLLKSFPKFPPSQLKSVSALKFRIDSALNRDQAAVKNFRKFWVINDSLFNATKSKQISELSIKFETEARKKDIQLLKSEALQKQKDLKILKAQKAVQQVQLQKANLQRNITIGGIAMLLIISGVVYNGYRNKKKSNIELEAKQLEINRQNASLQTLIAEKDDLLIEKDWLLKEVHHRVKNNLQIVMSLLSSQSAYLENTAALEAIRESQNRVHAIALIHQKLYSGSNVAQINMPVYVSDMVSFLSDCMDTKSRRIRVEQLIENFNLDLAQAVPLGLILNEAITNAIKYAFDKKGGEIIVALQQIGNDELMLNISDNGKGLPEDFDLKRASSLGMEMMKALSKQLGGEFKVRNNAGLHLSVEFVIERELSQTLKVSA